MEGRTNDRGSLKNSNVSQTEGGKIGEDGHRPALAYWREFALRGIRLKEKAFV
jgi:hypothetical protein